MNRALRGIVAVALVGSLGLAACGDSKSGDDAGSTTTAAAADGALKQLLPDGIRKSGAIRVGSDIEYAPIEFFKENT